MTGADPELERRGCTLKFKTKKDGGGVEGHKYSCQHV